YRRSLEIMERMDGFPGVISYAWQGLGEIACEHGDLATAAAWYRRARHLARRCGAIDVDALAALGLVRARLHGLTTGVRRRAALEAARTHLALAATLVARADHGNIPEEARTLLAKAQAQFSTSGAALDLAQAEQLAAAWHDQ